MKEKINMLGGLVAEIEKVSSTNFCKFLLKKFTGRFLTNQKDFIKIYSEIIQKAASLSIDPRGAIIAAKELSEYKYDRNVTEFEFWKGYSVYFIQSERKRVGLNIKNTRECKGLSQEDLAIRTGIKRPNISRIESGKCSTGIDLLGKIAIALEVDLKEIT